MSVSLTGGQAAGGQAGGAAPPPATGAAPDGGAQLPEWLKTIDDAELKADTTLHRYADVASLAKSHVHAQRMVGRDKIPLPGKDASPEDWKRVFNKLGLPEAPDLYKLQKPEGAELSDEFLGSVAKKAFELNILPHQAQELVAWLVKEEAEAAKQAGQSDDDAKQAAWGELQKEWGQGYDKEVRKAQLAFKQFADEKVTNHLNKTGLDKDPMLIRLFAKVGAALKEDAFRGEAVNSFGLTPAQAKQEMTSMLADEAGAYRNGKHPNHQAAVERYMKLAEAAAGL